MTEDERAVLKQDYGNLTILNEKTQSVLCKLQDILEDNDICNDIVDELESVIDSQRKIKE